jgi:hypothetical protein
MNDWMNEKVARIIKGTVLPVPSEPSREETVGIPRKAKRETCKPMIAKQKTQQRRWKSRVEV